MGCLGKYVTNIDTFVEYPSPNKHCSFTVTNAKHCLSEKVHGTLCLQR